MLFLTEKDVKRALTGKGIHGEAVAVIEEVVRYADGRDHFGIEVVGADQVLGDSPPRKPFASLVASGRFKAERDLVAELCDVVSGKKRGRESAGDIMLYESPGMGILDVGIGNWVYKRARELKLGVEMPFGEEEHEHG